jgi:peptide/nickel transport system permease protein
MFKIFASVIRNKTGLLGLTLIVLLFLIAFLGPLVIAPEPGSNPGPSNQPPSFHNPLGTDFEGRQNWILFVHGGREVLTVALLAGLFTTLIAVTVGAASAFFGGRTDKFIMSMTDIWLTLPRFLLLVVIATIIKLEGVFILSLLLAIIGWPGLARQVRAQFLSLKKRDYIEAALLLDLGAPHIIFREMLPSMMSYVLIAMINAMIGAIYSQTGLFFLGLVTFSNNWGFLFSSAYNKGEIYLPKTSANVLVPMSGIVLFQLGLVLFSRMLEEVFNPRLRQDR